ncbi:MAG: hypothetical protein RLZZ214_3696 [Verrucomicrobiota bacterium]|jgi:hypothetical protein
MTTKQEEYVHYDECIASLNRAWWILQKLRETQQRDAITAAAFRFALVEYAKPYTSSDGVHRNRKNRNSYKLLPPPSLSTEDLKLHKHILTLRDQVLAHSDLTWKDAAVYINRYGGELHAIIASNKELLIPDIDAVIGLTERTLEIMYFEQNQRLEDLDNTNSR